jgi:ATP-dependent RNA helicase RhlE
MTFDQLSLLPQILEAVKSQGYVEPTPIQELAIPPLLEGKDLLGSAQTGTGKTAAFAIPILQKLTLQPPKKQKAIRALILTPTRELAAQIQESFKTYGKFLKHKCLVIFGGVGQKPQTDALSKGPEILVATPGRFLDLYGQGYLHLDGLEYFVLDEADRMLDMGFIHDVRKIIALLPTKRQTMLFSATMPKDVEEIANAILTHPIRIAVTPVETTVEAIDQFVYHVGKKNKNALLTQLLEDKSVVSALVFSRTKHGANKIAEALIKGGVEAMAIHGNKSQSARTEAMGRFKAKKLRVLVATDIAARGIDIDHLSHVFNYDLPEVPETYIHRIGRTGRAGAAGIAISFCGEEEYGLLLDIEYHIGLKLTVKTDHPFAIKPSLQKPAPKTVYRSAPSGRRR